MNTSNIPPRFDITIELPMHPAHAYVHILVDGQKFSLVFDRNRCMWADSNSIERLDWIDKNHHGVLEAAVQFMQSPISVIPPEAAE